jgi:23S rRNA-/tRNA-specific pseudouridylate synthase
MVQLNNSGTFDLLLAKNPETGRWQMQIFEQKTGSKTYVLVYRKSIKQWRSLEKAIEYANNYLYNATTIHIVLQNNVTLICKRD